MNIKYYTLLRYLLIILLMFAPMRGVLAMQQVHCEMDNMEASSQNAVMAGMHDMSTMSLADSKHHNSYSPTNQSIANSHQCCCCDDGGNCAGNCDMGITVSLLMQVSPYSPVFVNTEKLILSSPALLVRALTPPSRPPLNIS